MNKPDPFADLRGLGVTFVSATKKLRTKCFISGINEIQLSFHPLDKEAAIQQYADAKGISYEEEAKLWKPPYDYVFCPVIDVPELIAFLRAGNRVINGSEWGGKTWFRGTPVQCPF